MRFFPTIQAMRLIALSDEEIVGRVRAGETSLFEILMRRHNQRLYRTARSIVGNEGEAEDVMQEAYVRAFQHLPQFEGRSRFSTWLTKIVVHEASLRRRRAVRFLALDTAIQMSPAEAAPPHASDPEMKLFEGEVRLLLERAVDALPPDYRAVFILREIEEMDTAEAAETLMVSEEVVRTRLMRARAMLREHLYRSARITTGLFELHLARCDRVVLAVMPRIAPQAWTAREASP